MMTIGLADDEPLFTAGLAMILEAQPDMQVLWQAVDGADAVRRHSAAPPDILLLDIQMPTLDGLAATELLVSANTGTKIIIVTAFDTDEYVLTAVEAGASGFLLKNTPPVQVVESIRTVHRGDAVISPGPTRRLFRNHRATQTRRPTTSDYHSATVEDVTPRERDILVLIAEGCSNQEICDELWLSMATVKTHIGNLIAKTHSQDRVQLVLYALRTGIASLCAERTHGTKF